MNKFFIMNQDAQKAVEFLRQNNIDFEEVSLENSAAAEYVSGICGAPKNLLIAGNAVLVDPTIADLAHYLLKKEEKGERANFDVIIGGAGPGGMTTAIYSSRGNYSTCIIEEMLPGGLMTKTDEIENYPGFPEPINGFELGMKMEQQAKRFGTRILNGRITEMILEPPVKEVRYAGGSVFSPNVVISFGTEHRTIGVKGEAEFNNLGVSYCATCDGPLYRGREVFVIGGGDSAIQEALFLSKLASKVTVVHRRDELRAQKLLQERAFATENLQFVWSSVPVEILGDKNGVTGIILKNRVTGEETQMSCEAIFIFVGLIPQANVTGMEKLERDGEGFLVTDRTTLTNIAGVFAVGDIRSGNQRQIATAVGDGCAASYGIEHNLLNLKIPEFQG